MANQFRPLIVFLCCLNVCHVFADLSPANPPNNTALYFSIPKQPLGSALNDFAATAGVSIIFDPSSIQGAFSNPLQGEFKPQQALNALLRGREFVAKPLKTGWVIQKQKKLNQSTEFELKPLEETLIIGNYTNSLQLAIAESRNSTQLREMIYAEEVGKFPTLNIAEALKRLSGVSVIRDRGEARFISIRGLPSQFHLLTFNGHEIASNENVRTSDQFGRRFHYHLLPSELISSVTIDKSQQASDLEGGIGGLVDLQGYKPLELGSTIIRSKLALARSELVGKNDPRVSLLSNWVNEDENLGITFAGSFIERSLRQDRALNFAWLEEENPITPDSKLATPGGVRPTLEREQRHRSGALLSLQWLPNINSLFEVNYLGLVHNIDYEEYSYSADYEVEDLLADSAIIRDNALVGGAVDTGSVQIGRESTGIKDSNHNLDVLFKNRWRHIDYQLSMFSSSATSKNDKPIRRTRLRISNEASFVFQYPSLAGREQVPDITYRNIDLDDATAFPGRRLEWRVNNVADRKDGAAVEGELGLGNGAATLEFGITWQQHKRNYQRRDVIIEAGIAGQFFDQSYFSPFPVRNFLAQVDASLPREWLIPNERQFWQGLNSDLFKKTPSDQDLQNSYRVLESTHSAFFQYVYKSDSLSGNAGIRLVDTQQETQGHRANDATALMDDIRNSQDYMEYLPAMNINWEFIPGLHWRSALGRTLNRPDLQDLSPRLTFNSGDAATASSGNPELKAATAWQLDSALEWYFDEQGFISSTLFAQHLNGFVHNSLTNVDINGEAYLLASKSNGGEAEITGLEIDFHQVFNFWPRRQRRIGLSANVTFINSSAEYSDGNRSFVDKLEDVAEKTANLEVFFENKQFNARINYSWNSELLRHVGLNNTASRNSKAFGSLDLHLSYKAIEGLNIFLEAINANNRAEQEFVLDNEFAGYSHYGRTFILGIRADLL